MIKTTKRKAWLARVAFVLMIALVVQTIFPAFARASVEANPIGIMPLSLGYNRIVNIPIHPPIVVEVIEGIPPDEIIREIVVNSVSVSLTTNLPASINTHFEDNGIFIRQIPSDLHQGPIVFNAEGVGTMRAEWQADNSIRIDAQELSDYTWIRTHVSATGRVPLVNATITVAPRQGNQLTVGVIGQGTTVPSGVHVFTSNQQVSVSANPAAGSEFVAWRGPDSHLLDNPSSAHTFFPASATTRNLSITAEFRGGQLPTPTPGVTPTPTPGTPRTITVQNIPAGWSILVSNSTPAGVGRWTVNAGVSTTVQIVRTGTSAVNFQRWSADNVDLSNQATSPNITFTMPDQDVILIPTMQQGGIGPTPTPGPIVNYDRIVDIAIVRVPVGHSALQNGPLHPGQTAIITLLPATSNIGNITFNVPGIVPVVVGNTATFVVPDFGITERVTLTVAIDGPVATPPPAHIVELRQTPGGSVWSSHIGAVLPNPHVHIEATPFAGFIFVGWQVTGVTMAGWGSGLNQSTFRIETFIMPPSNVTIAARFEPDPNWNGGSGQQIPGGQLGPERILTLQGVTPAAAGRVEILIPPAPGNVVQQGAQTRRVRANANVTISAIANTGWEFVRWEIISQGALGNFPNLHDFTRSDLSFPMPNFDLILRPYFRTTTREFTLTVIGGTGPTTFAPGTNITVTATIPQGQRFVRWEAQGISLTGAIANQPNPTIAIPTGQTQNILLTAIFEAAPTPTPTPVPTPQPTPMPTPVPTPTPAQFSVSVDIVGGGSVTGIGMRSAGISTSVTAVPNFEHRFVRWEVLSGGITLASPTATTTSFVMPHQNVTLRAIFETDGPPPEVTVTMPPVPERPVPPSEQRPDETLNGVDLPDTSDPVSLTLIMGGLATLSSFFLFKTKKEDQE